MYSAFLSEMDTFAAATIREHTDFESGRLSKRDIHAIQDSRLSDIISYVSSNSTFYNRHLGDLSDTFDRTLLHGLPFTTKNDLRTAGTDMLCGPIEDAWVYYETTGTTGPSTPCPRNEIDSLVNNTVLTLRYGDILAQHGDRHVVAVMGPTELHSTGDTFEDVLRALRHTVVKLWPRSPVVGTARALHLIRELGVTAIVCTPGVTIMLARELVRRGIDPRSLGITAVFLIGELMTPALLRIISETWGAAAYNCMYASQESSILGAARANGRIYSVPLNNLYELIDPDSSEIIEAPDHGGEVCGELVVTTLYRGQKPLIRYRTGDVMRVSSRPDGSWELDPVGRTRDRMTIGGHRFTAYELENAVLEGLSGCLDYQIGIDHVDGVDCLDVVVERLRTTDAFDVDRAARSIGTRIGIPTAVRCGKTDHRAAAGAMVSWKAARLDDRRSSEPDAEHAAAVSLTSRWAAS